MAALYLNEVGEFIRHLSVEPDLLDDVSNLDLVRDLLNTLEETPEVLALKIIQDEQEAIHKEEAELFAKWKLDHHE